MKCDASGRPALDHRAWDAHGTLWIAFSGGPDSTCLLHRLIAAGLAARLHAVHVDHRLDEASADRADRACRVAASLAVPCDRITLDPRRLREGVGTEAAAREARYAAIAERLAPGETVLTAHHLDDRIETLFLMLMRGAGPRGLAGMPVRRPLGRGWLGRPLLAWTRAELRAELEDAGIDWIADPTNDDDGPDRNHLRNDVLPIIEARWPGYRSAVLRSLGWLDHAADAVEQRAVDDRSALIGRRGASVRSAEPGANDEASSETVLDRRAWLALPEARALEVLRDWLRPDPPPGHERLTEFRAQCHRAGADRTPVLVDAAYRLHAWRDALWLDRGPATPSDWAVEARDAPIEGDRTHLDLPADLGRIGWRSIRGRVAIGALDPGERLRLHQGGPRRKAAELLREAGLPPWRRHRVPALRVDGRLRALGTRWQDPMLVDAGLSWTGVPDDLLPYVHRGSMPVRR
ncbi:tRNA lysidine(34) synthetase TilS [Halomonas denitrificans]|nr:tRNA lysidine(34) synthetase TilS [Halomonas denitrificans]